MIEILLIIFLLLVVYLIFTKNLIQKLEDKKVNLLSF